MNAYASHMVSYLLAQSWQIALLAGMVGLISLTLRNRSAHLRYLLWLIVLAKCLVPPFLAVPLAVLPERSASPPVAVAALPEEHFAIEVPLLVGGGSQPRTSTLAMPSSREWAALGWMAGMCLFLLWVGGRAMRYTAWLRQRRRPVPPAWQESIPDSSLGFQFRRWPSVWLVDGISQPFVWGLLRGSVYLPADFVGVSGSDQQRSILAHELSHIARFDAGVNLLQVLAQAVYWFHPFVWWANRRIRLEREKCCDEMAVAHLRTPPEHYTEAIVGALAAERRSAHPVPSLAIVGSVRDIEERIKTMLRPGKTFRKRPSLVAATAALLIALVTIPTALVLTARGQAQPIARSVDKPAAATASSAEPERPRYAARTFNAKTSLDVFIQRTPLSKWEWIGRTPSAVPLEIPACWCWWIQTPDLVKDWDLLTREMNENRVSGLRLNAATNADVKHLAGLTELAWLGLGGAEVTDTGLAYLKDLTGLRLEKLGLSGTGVTDGGLANLAGMTGLWQLDLPGINLTDAGLRHLRALSGLHRLDLSRTQITDAGLENLRGLTQLRWLDLSGTKITDAGLENLKSLTGLRVLCLSKTQITNAGLAKLKGLEALESLSLQETQVTDAGLEHLKSLTELQELYLLDCKITDAGLEHLKGMASLQQLFLMNTEITDAGLEHLKGLTGLRRLFYFSRNTKITDTGLAHLKGLTRLEMLDLSYAKVTDAGLVHLEDMPQLESLNLEWTAVTDAGLVHLRGLTRLNWLCLLGTKIDGTGLAHLKGLPGLGFLNLTGTQVTDEGLANLEGLTGLGTLYLQNTKVTDLGLEHLKGLTHLGYLDLSGTRVTDAGVQGLKQSLPNLTIQRAPLGVN